MNAWNVNGTASQACGLLVHRSLKKRRLMAACLSGEDGCPSVKRNGRRAQARQRRASGTAYCSCTRGEGEALSTQLKKPASGLKPSGNDDSRRGLEATTQVGASGNAPRARDRRRMARTAPRAWFTRARPEGCALIAIIHRLSLAHNKASSAADFAACSDEYFFLLNWDLPVARFATEIPQPSRKLGWRNIVTL